MGAKRAGRPSSEAFSSEGLPEDTLYGQVLAKGSVEASQRPNPDHAHNTADVSQRSRDDEDDLDLEMPPAPTLDEKKRKAISEAEETIVKRKFVGKQPRL